MSDYSLENIIDAGETLSPLKNNQLEVLEEINSGYSSQQEIADELDIGRSTISKYMKQFRDAPVPLIETYGHDSWTTSHAQYLLKTLEEEIDLEPHTTKRRNDIAALTLHKAETGDTISQLRTKVDEYNIEHSSHMYERSFLPDYFENGVFNREEDIIEVTEKGETQKEILYKTADQLVEETGDSQLTEEIVGAPEKQYKFALYLVEETEDGLKPIKPIEEDSTVEEISELLNETL